MLYSLCYIRFGDGRLCAVASFPWLWSQYPVCLLITKKWGMEATTMTMEKRTHIDFIVKLFEYASVAFSLGSICSANNSFV